MKYYRFPENKWVKLCFPVLLLVLQIVARSTMYTSVFLDFELSQAIMLAVIVLIGIAFLVVNRKSMGSVLKDERMAFFALSAVVILAPMVVKQDWQLMYFTVLLSWWFAVFLTYFSTLQEISYWYVLITTVLSVLTLAGQFLLKPMAQAGIIPAWRFLSPGGWHMLNFGLTFACEMTNRLDDSMRVFGIFREPGLLQVFLFIAIVLNNHQVCWKFAWQRWAVNVILAVTLLVTFATGGVVALAMYIVFLFFDEGFYKNKRLRILAAVVVLAGIAFIAVSVARGGTWAIELVWMVQKVFEKTDSYTSRVGSVFADARIFLENPFFGANLSDVMYAVPNNTATSPILFAAFGIFTGCVHVISWAALLWKKQRHWLMNVILMTIAFMPFNTQNVIPDLFFWVFPVMALVERGIPAMDRLLKKKKVN